MRKMYLAALLGLVASLIMAIPSATATNSGTTEGCTPGYWKNHTESWEEYGPGYALDDVFDFPASLSSFERVTLEQALALKGGSGTSGAAQILLRAATASVLNAAHEGVGYPYRRFKEPFGIVPQVNAALASGDRATMLALAATLDAANNLGCPL